ncbi:hypothetical protein [Listeria newyorkensis]|uniref:Uncharacterized protein n=1 Tax=Listeria newyorkensis TaxID=1497681 RepID=A0A841Z060_9LIST|nr:hypothetical protein [Listeria newyorkensis]MBC1458166.1 hypothetical protein [Listeria newyorkensis]
MKKQVSGCIMLFLGATLLPNFSSFLYSWALNGSDFEPNWILWATLSLTILLFLFGILSLLEKTILLANLLVLLSYSVFQSWMLWQNQLEPWIKNGELGLIDYSRLITLLVALIGIAYLFIKTPEKTAILPTDWQKKWRWAGVFFAILGLGVSITLAVIVLSGEEFFFTTPFDAYLGIGIAFFFLLAIVFGFRKPNAFITAPLLGLSFNFFTEYLWLEQLLRKIGSQIGSQIGQDENTVVALKLIIGTLGIFASLFLIIATQKKKFDA